MEEDQSRLNDVNSISERTQVNTSAPGREVLRREVDSLWADSKTSLSDAAEAKSGLERALDEWNAFENAHESFCNWLRQTEQKTKDFELKSTLEEKEEQLEKFLVCECLRIFACIVKYRHHYCITFV